MVHCDLDATAHKKKLASDTVASRSFMIVVFCFDQHAAGQKETPKLKKGALATRWIKIADCYHRHVAGQTRKTPAKTQRVPRPLARSQRIKGSLETECTLKPGSGRRTNIDLTIQVRRRKPSKSLRRKAQEHVSTVKLSIELNAHRSANGRARLFLDRKTW